VAAGLAGKDRPTPPIFGVLAPLALKSLRLLKLIEVVYACVL
jgi:hypothetical protein